MFARALLRVAEVPYTLAVRIRNSRYDRGLAEVQRVDVPVISVGNLTLGGTGKTPMVAYLARWLRSQGVCVTIVSRGYGAEQGSRNDEALELEQLLPDVPHLQNPDRVAASRVAVEELECQIILLDDGFQHRRLHRDLDIVLLDALESDGHGHVFPRGTLREPFSGLSRADVVVLSRCDLADKATRAALHDRVMKVVPNAVWMEVSHRPIRLRNSSGDVMPLAQLEGARVTGFCGIGNPPAFRRTLENIGYQIVSFREFADHHRYDR